MNIPSKETIAYSRRQIEREITKLQKWLLQIDTNMDKHKIDRIKYTIWTLEKLLGQGGCVIAPFDTRWLDDQFRSKMSTVYKKIN